MDKMAEMEEKKIILETIKILGHYNKLYQKISNGRYKDYITYISRGRFGDEDELIKPKLWIDFLENILGFPKDEYIPELPGATGRKPDFIPRDLRVHPFIFEIKGTDSENLKDHYFQIAKYIKTPIKWGVITNMRDLLTFEAFNSFPISDYSFSFLQLYKDYKSHPKGILDFSNTKRFLSFVRRFKFQEFSLQDKIEKIKEAKPWTGKETLDPDELIKTIHKVTRLLVEDAKQHKSRLPANLRFDPKTKESIAREIETIACELDRSRTPTAKSLDKLISAKPGTIEFQAFETFFNRVAYFTMTRILLARMWEDIGFIDQSLYNGGFERWYETFNRQIEKVLEYAFNLAGKRYSWLYHIPNNYSWYIPSERTLIEVLYEFSNYNLGKLNTDVLGTVYEVDEIIKAKEKLSKYNKFFTRIRLRRLENPKDVPEPDPITITKSLPSQEQRILRTHPEIKVESKDTTDFYLSKVGKTRETIGLFAKSIYLTSRNKKQLAVTAPKEFVYYLEEVLNNYKGKSFNEIKEISLPRDWKIYKSRKDEILKEVKRLLTKIQSLQSKIDGDVYQLYGITEQERRVIEERFEEELRKRLVAMTPAHVAVERNINTAVGEKTGRKELFKRENRRI